MDRRPIEVIKDGHILALVCVQLRSRAEGSGYSDGRKGQDIKRGWFPKNEQGMGLKGWRWGVGNSTNSALEILGGEVIAKGAFCLVSFLAVSTIKRQPPSHDPPAPQSDHPKDCPTPVLSSVL